MSTTKEMLKYLYEEYIEVTKKQLELNEKKKELNLKLLNLNSQMLLIKKEGQFTVKIPIEFGIGKFTISKKIKRKLNQKRIIEDFIKLPKEFRAVLVPQYKLDLRDYRRFLSKGVRFEICNYVEEKEMPPNVKFNYC